MEDDIKLQSQLSGYQLLRVPCVFGVLRKDYTEEPGQSHVPSADAGCRLVLHV